MLPLLLSKSTAAAGPRMVVVLDLPADTQAAVDRQHKAAEMAGCAEATVADMLWHRYAYAVGTQGYAGCLLRGAPGESASHVLCLKELCTCQRHNRGGCPVALAVHVALGRSIIHVSQGPCGWSGDQQVHCTSEVTS